MKKFLFALLLMPAAVWAQPNLVSVPSPIGDTITAFLFEYNVPTYPKSGNNNWDFSALSKNAVDSIGIKMLNPASTPYAADFPTANLCQRIKILSSSTEAYFYASLSADSLWELGSRYPTFSILDETLVNPDVAYRFPFSLNQTQMDISSNTNGDVDSSKQKYVGWGNIKTPYGDFNNVILIEDIRFNNASNSWEVENLNWISVATLLDVASIDVGDSSGTWYKYQAGSSATQDFLMSKYSLSLYPNPSSTQSHVAFNLTETANVAVQLIAVDGKTNTTLLADKRNAGKHIVPINTDSLAAGTYFIRVIIDNQPMVKTLQVVK